MCGALAVLCGALAVLCGHVCLSHDLYLCGALAVLCGALAVLCCHVCLSHDVYLCGALAVLCDALAFLCGHVCLSHDADLCGAVAVYGKVTSSFCCVHVWCRTLQDECSRLQQAEDMHENGSDDVFEDLELSTSGDNDMLTEAMLLRRHEGRLDARMHILSEYNSQLSGQLTGLKKLLEQVAASFLPFLLLSFLIYPFHCM